MSSATPAVRVVPVQCKKGITNCSASRAAGPSCEGWGIQGITTQPREQFQARRMPPDSTERVNPHVSIHNPGHNPVRFSVMNSVPPLATETPTPIMTSQLENPVLNFRTVHNNREHAMYSSPFAD
ncbi:hypothetical protein V8E54_001198 [Elaphomyces granulatus]